MLNSFWRTAMNNRIIELNDVKVTRGGRCIVNIGRFAVNKGQHTTVTGTNGAGKTTLLKLCCGLVKPDCGSVLFKGTETAALTSWKRTSLNRHIGYVPQISEYNADLPFTVREIVQMGLAGRQGLGIRLNSPANDEVSACIEQTGLMPLAERTFRSLSGGEQQKTLIARAMVAKPMLLLMDEPGSNTDYIFKRHLKSLLELLCADDSVTLVMVSHDVEMITSYCRRAIVMNKGCIVSESCEENMPEEYLSDTDVSE